MGETAATILIVDDEAGVRDLLGDALRIAGYETLVASDGDEALTLWRTNDVELCIVDVNMPTMNGFEFVEAVRRDNEALPILLLSARDAAVDVAHGLRIGADDYVRKPFSLEELLLRVAAILRRTSGATEDDRVLVCGPLTMNVDRHEVSVGEDVVDMSATEFRLLEVLLAKKNHLLTREQLLRDVWDITFDSETSVLDTYISYLRKKIHRDDFAPITTVRGVGFKLVDPRPSA
ncbi:MAG: response regulator transcription factor [Actinomycetales bacterium]|nr:response regulator transcription factor [Actinomycetales bacterium]